MKGKFDLNSFHLPENAVTDEMLNKVREQFNFSFEKQLEEQFKNVVKQAVLSGDFTRFVFQDHANHGKLYYSPFTLKEQLQARIKLLEDFIKDKFYKQLDERVAYKFAEDTFECEQWLKDLLE
jgi:hypothetical protein